MSPEAAKIVAGLVSQFRASTEIKLTGIVPEHTKKALEMQLEHSREAERELERARANPVEVEIPDPSGS